MKLWRWLAEKRGDIVWNTLVIVTVMLPLMGFTLDIPRYFILRSTLQNAVDAAAEAAAQTLDAAAFINAGEIRLDDYAASSANNAFYAAASPMTDRGYNMVLDGIHIDEANDRVTAAAHGEIRYIFGLTPAIAIRVQGQSSYRSIRE